MLVGRVSVSVGGFDVHRFRAARTAGSGAVAGWPRVFAKVMRNSIALNTHNACSSPHTFQLGKAITMTNVEVHIHDPLSGTKKTCTPHLPRLPSLGFTQCRPTAMPSANQHVVGIASSFSVSVTPRPLRTRRAHSAHYHTSRQGSARRAVSNPSNSALRIQTSSRTSSTSWPPR